MKLHLLVLCCLPFGALAIRAGARRTVAEEAADRPLTGCILMHGAPPHCVLGPAWFASPCRQNTKRRFIQMAVLKQTSDIARADSRFTPALERNLSSAADVDSMKHYEAAFHINRLYARRHGYAFVFQTAAGAATDRAQSWAKVQLLRDQLACCCQWALYMDSDSFLVMLDQRLALEAWLAEDDGPQMTALLGNMYPVPGPAPLREGTDPIAMTGSNTPYESRGQYFCAGNLLFTRTRRSLEVLDFWYNTTGRSREYDKFLTGFPWEQVSLNHNVSRKWPHAFLRMAGTDDRASRYIRHLWHPFGVEEQTSNSAQYLRDVLSQHRW